MAPPSLTRLVPRSVTSRLGPIGKALIPFADKQQPVAEAMQFRTPPSLGRFLGAILVAAASPALASTSATVSLSGGAEQVLYNPLTDTREQTRDGTGGTLRQDQSDPDSRDVSVSIVDSRVAGLANVFASGSATASVAGVRMSALVTGSAGAQNLWDGAFFGGSVQVSGSSFERFVLLAPGLALGAPLELTAGVYTDATTRNIGSTTPDGNFSTEANWVATFHLSENGGTATTIKRMEQACVFSNIQTLFCSGNGPETGELKLVVPNGATLALQIVGTANARGSAGAPGPNGSASIQAGADLGNTIAWAGITSLKDANGNVITDFSALGGTTGFDYRGGYVAPVPLPPTVALLATALAGVAARRKLRPARPA